MKRKDYEITDFQSWIAESTAVHQIWQADSWEDAAFADGSQWQAGDKAALLEKGINPITANRIFPVVNLITGYAVTNQEDIVAKARTQADSEVSQIMSESMAFVLDQCEGDPKVMSSFTDSVIPGFGYLKIDTQPDPRREKVTVKKYPWYTFGWDIHGDPWLDPDRCRYCYQIDWKDVEDLKALFPKMANDITEQFRQMASGTSRSSTSTWTTLDVGNEVENFRTQMVGSSWADSIRGRARPVELFYTVREDATFCIFDNGRTVELTDKMPVNDQFAAIMHCREVVKANVNKIRIATLLGNLVLQDIKSPHPHDKYPFAPFYGYFDRFGLPYGAPRQLKEQQMEVNKRRSMALALLGAKRMLVEEGAVEDAMKAFSEANSLKGLIEVAEGKLDRVRIDDLDDMAATQISLMQISEGEIKEISGANDEALGYSTPVMSGKALENKTQRSHTMTANLFEHFKRSKTKVGELLMSEIQHHWTGPKVLRVTDRMSGADKFVEINQQTVENGVIKVKNNITEGRFDTVVAQRPMTDTMKEKTIDLLFSSINSAPQEAMAPLLNIALSMLDFPMKEELLRQLRNAMGTEEIDYMLSQEERDAQTQAAQEALAQKQAEDAQHEYTMRQLEIATAEAEIGTKKASAARDVAEADAVQKEAASKEYEVGFKQMQDLITQRSLGRVQPVVPAPGTT